MLADEDLAPDAQGHRVLQMRTDGQHGRHGFAEHHGQRRVSARAAQDHLALHHDAHDRVINVARDRPVVDQKEVCQPRQPREARGIKSGSPAATGSAG